MPSNDEKMKAVRDYIAAERHRLGVTKLDTNAKPETSGMSCGEDGDLELLINRQLLTTREGYGGWLELTDQRTLDRVYEIIGMRE